jgi:hypothetical protein
MILAKSVVKAAAQLSTTGDPSDLQGALDGVPPGPAGGGSEKKKLFPSHLTVDVRGGAGAGRERSGSGAGARMLERVGVQRGFAEWWLGRKDGRKRHMRQTTTGESDVYRVLEQYNWSAPP